MINNHDPLRFVENRVQAAGRTLLLMHANGLRPRGYVSNWPEHIRELVDTIDVNEEERTVSTIKHDPRPVFPRPTSREISEMDEVMGWMAGLGMYCRIRKIPYVCRTVGLRMLHHPEITGKKYSFSRIAKRFGAKSRQTPINWYDDGIAIIARALNIDANPENLIRGEFCEMGSETGAFRRLTPPKNS